MIPIGDDRIEGQKTAVVTIGLIIINVLIFLQEIKLGPEQFQVFVSNYGAIPAEIQQGQHLSGLFTSMFLHGGWMHLIGNMLFLWIFGDNIEHVLGKAGFLLFYLAGGIIASLGHVLANLGSPVPSLGASGAISAVMGAYIVMFPRSQIRTLVFLGFFITTIRISAFIFLGIWFALQLLNGTSTSDIASEQGGVAWFAHIGGFVFGLLCGIIFRTRAAFTRRSQG